MTSDADDDLLAAWVLNALSPLERAEIDDRVARDPQFEQRARRLLIAVTALGEVSGDPPAQVRDRVTDAALALRPDRASLLRAREPISALEAFIRQWAELDALLDALSDDDWDATTSFGRPVRDLLVHEAAQLRHVAAMEFAMPNPGPASPSHDHWGLSEPLIDALRPMPVSATVDTLRGAARVFIDAAGAATPEAWTASDAYTTLVDRTVGRAIELWMHTDDVRAAVGREWVDPDAARLGLMCEVAARFIPLGIAVTGVAVPGRTARLVLLGAGGGTWPVPLGGISTEPLASAPDVVVVAMAAPFCRMAGRLLEPDALAIAVDGDGVLVAPLFAGARAFSE